MDPARSDVLFVGRPGTLRTVAMRSVICGIVAALILGCGSTFVLAQQRTKQAARPDTAEKAKPASRPDTEKGSDDGSDKAAGESESPESVFSPFGDTKKFTRVGGWGGIGSGMAQWGMGRSMLIMMPAVQEELQLTEEQKQALVEWTRTMRDRGREMAEGLRQESEAVMRQLDVMGAMRMMGRMNEIFQENEAGVARILTKSQRKRLDQIALQMEGITALTRPDVAQALQMTDVQREKVQYIIAQSQLRQIGYWMQQGMSMRERFERERTARQQGEADTPGRREPAGADRRPSRKSEAAQNTADDDASTRDTEAEPRPRDDPQRAQRIAEFRTRFEEMRNGADQLHLETVQQLLKVLAPRQRTNFERLLGPPFDPDRLVNDMVNARRQREADRAAASDRVRPRGGEENQDG